MCIILDQAEEEGIGLYYSCRAGACFSCVAKLYDGWVDQQEQTFLDDSQVFDGWVLLCVAFPTSDCTLYINQEDYFEWENGVGWDPTEDDETPSEQDDLAVFTLNYGTGLTSIDRSFSSSSSSVYCLLMSSNPVIPIVYNVRCEAPSTASPQFQGGVLMEFGDEVIEFNSGLSYQSNFWRFNVSNNLGIVQGKFYQYI